MSNISQSFFSFFVGELVSVVLAIIVKDEKKRVRILVVGTVLSGVLAFILQGRVLATAPNLAQNPTLPTATSISSTQTKEPLSPEITDVSGAQMVLVPAGSFLMGSNNADNERPIHDVNLDSYYIDKYEVTNDMYVEFLNDVISEVVVEPNGITLNVRYKGVVLGLCPTCGDLYKDKLTWDGSRFGVVSPFNTHPVVAVTWYGARNYCEWRKTRLPTEAEWEKAAHGTDNRIYPWGDTIDCTKSNYTQSCVGNTSPVGSFGGDISPYGAYDMAGNAWEWVEDWYSDTYYQNSPYQNPPGPDSGFNRVLRGGAFYFDNDSSRSAFRSSSMPDIIDILEGFRCARDTNP